MVYYGLVIWIFLVASICFCRRGKINFKKNKNIFMFLSFAAIVIVLGMRDQTVGVDTQNYYNIFSNVARTPFLEIIKHFYFLTIEVGYIVLMKVVSIFGNYYLFQMVVSIITCGLFLKFIKDNMENDFLGVILFLGLDTYLLLFNISRQMLAVALIVNYWTYLKFGKKIKAFVLLLCAGFIHTTAWIFVVFWFVYFIRNNKFFIRILPMVGVLIIFSYEKVLDAVALIVPHYANYYGNHKTILEAGFSMVIWCIITIISIVLIIKNIKDVKKENKKIIVAQRKIALNWNVETYLYAGFSLFYVASNVIGLSFNYFERLGCYFVPFAMISFERFGMQIKNIIIRRMYFCGVIVCFVIYFILSTKTDQYLYQFFW